VDDFERICEGLDGLLNLSIVDGNVIVEEIEYDPVDKRAKKE
jgi:hypothetical protein